MEGFPEMPKGPKVAEGDEEKFDEVPEGPDGELPGEEEISTSKAPEVITDPDTDPPEKMPEHTLEGGKTAESFQEDEKNVLASVEGKGEKMGKFREAFTAMTKGGKKMIGAGVLAFMVSQSPDALAAEKPEGGHVTDAQGIEQQIQKLQEEKLHLEQMERSKHEAQRIHDLEESVKGFGVKGLELKPHKEMRCLCEEYDVYVDGNRLGHVMSEKREFPRDEFISAVKNMLVEKGLYEQAKLHVEVSPDAQAIMDAWGWVIQDGRLDFGDKEHTADLNDDGMTESVSIVAAGKDRIVITTKNKDGTVSTAEGVRGKLTIK